VNRTQIEWVKNPDGTQGYTWNPITGCLNGCEYCYARKLANGRLKERYRANHNVAPLSTGSYPEGDTYADPFYPRFWEERLGDIKRGYHYQSFEWAESEFAAKARGVFVCDMSDLFGIGVPEVWTRKVLKAINTYDNRGDRFYLLTKQPQNLLKFSPFPENCWVGVTYTGGDGFTKALAGLKEVQATVKYLSIEPFLAEIPRLALVTIPKVVNWVIIGAQTKPYKPPKIEWVEEIVKACDKAGVKVFLKNNLKPLLINDKGFGNVSPGVLIEREIESGTYKLRQEIPK